MRTRYLAVPLLTLLIGLVACDGDGDQVTGVATRFNAQLTGAKEVPPVTTSATGTATFRVQGNTVEFTLNTTGLQNVTAAHIHGPAPADSNAAVIVGLFNAPTEGAWTGSKTGSFTTANLSTTQPVTTLDALLGLMRAGRTYVNVHTSDNPAGAIRGQVTAQ